MLTTEKDSLRQEISGKDETISILEQALEEAKRRADLGDEAYKKAYRQAEEEGDIELLNEVTDEEIDRLDKLHEQNLEDSIARRRESAAMNFLKGNIDKAKQRLNEILEQHPNDPDAINRMAHINVLQGNLTVAETGYERLLEIAGNDRLWQAAAYGNLGLIYHTQGDLDRAEKMHQQALDIDQELGKKEGMAIQYASLGLINHTQGDVGGAKQYFEQSLNLYKEVGMRSEIEQVQGWLNELEEEQE